MNVIKKAKLETREDIKEFVTNNTKMTGEVFARSGSYLINGKSILGVLSLDLEKPIDVEFFGEEDEVIKTLERNAKFLLD